MIAAPPLDAVSAIWFGGVLVVALLLTVRRPSLGAAFLLLTDPFAVARYAGHTTLTSFKAALIGVAAGLLLRGRFALPLRGRAGAIALALGAVAVATALTVPHAAQRAAALRETLKAAEYLAIFAVAYAAARADRRRAAPALSAACAAVAIVVALGAFADYAHPQSGIWFGQYAYVRLAGALEGPNQLASWLGIVLPFALLSPLALAAAICGCAALALSLSRSGDLQALAAFVATALADWRARRLGLATGLTAFVLSVIGFGLVVRSEAALARYSSVESSVDRGGTGERSILWSAAVRMFRAHPLLGVGAGNFEFELPHYGAPTRVRTQANSLYLEALADGGIVLGAATVVAALLPAWLLLRGAAPASFTATAGIVGLALAAHGLLDDVVFYTKVGQAWWVLAGAAAAFTAPAERSSTSRPGIRA